MMKKNNSKETRRGAASLYVVIFVTLLFGVITLSFIRLVISEAVRTTNTDLSQSAYDSALAGIEDAKVALLKYHDCLSQGYQAGDGSECELAIKNMQAHIDNDSCDPVTKTLGRTQEEDGSVIIQETFDKNQAGNAAEMVQAYTCVKISEELDDYRTTLSNGSRMRIIPIRSSELENLTRIRVRWFSDQNKGNRNFNLAGVRSNDASIPPVISVQLLQADKNFKLSELSVTSAKNTTHGSTDRATVYLTPANVQVDERESLPNIVGSKWFASQNDKTLNSLKYVACEDANSTAEWLCEANIEVPYTYQGNKERNWGATFLLITLPYGDPTTDISLQLYKGNNPTDLIKFTGVQARVDSTGRANDLYRRVETRVELVDVNYPYPEFTIQMTDGQDNVIKKNFSVTRNCWYSEEGKTSESGSGVVHSFCPQNKQLSN